MQDKIDVFRDMISALTEDAQNDAKSSAGDKHETGLSMMHLEQEKLNVKLKECLEQKAILDRIDAKAVTNRVMLGSLVRLNHMDVFVSCALPKILMDGQPIFAISPQSPLGNLLLGQVTEKSLLFNNQTYLIKEIS